MSQSATFYPLDKNAFESLSNDLSALGDLLADKEFTTIHSTHEGLRFVLAKGKDMQTVQLVDSIFYPGISIGGEERSDEGPYEGPVYEEGFIYYHPPQKVATIAALLEATSSEEIRQAYDPEELNREMVYPWCWNRKSGDSNAFNEEDLLESFQSLKNFFLSARQKGAFVLSFVG
jgi:hypothetical protein